MAAASLIAANRSVPALFAMAFVLSAASIVFNPAAASLLPDVVDADDVVTANSALWSAAVTAQIAIAPIAGLVIALSGVRTAFAVNALTFVVSALALRGLAAGRTPASIEMRGWSGALGGVNAVRADPLLRRLMVVQILASLSAGATSGLLVVLANRSLGVGPTGFGLLLAAIGAGAVAGPILARRFIRTGDRRWLFGPYLVRGGVDVALSAVGSPGAAGSLLVVYGMSTSTGMVAYQSTLQRAIPAELRGRAFAFYDVVWNVVRLVSLAVGGLMADRTDVRLVYLAGGALLVAAAVAGLTTRISTNEASPE